MELFRAYHALFGSPPHQRRDAPLHRSGGYGLGNTSGCVGQTTNGGSCPCSPDWDLAASVAASVSSAPHMASLMWAPLAALATVSASLRSALACSVVSNLSRLAWVRLWSIDKFCLWGHPTPRGHV